MPTLHMHKQIVNLKQQALVHMLILLLVLLIQQVHTQTQHLPRPTLRRQTLVLQLQMHQQQILKRYQLVHMPTQHFQQQTQPVVLQLLLDLMLTRHSPRPTVRFLKLPSQTEQVFQVVVQELLSL